jgi:hypothetical protein
MGRKVDGQWGHPNHVAGRFGPVPLVSNNMECPELVPSQIRHSTLPNGRETNVAIARTSPTVVLAVERITQFSHRGIAVAETHDLHIKVMSTVQFRRPSDRVHDPLLVVAERSTTEQC